MIDKVKDIGSWTILYTEKKVSEDRREEPLKKEKARSALSMNNRGQRPRVAQKKHKWEERK